MLGLVNQVIQKPQWGSVAQVEAGGSRAVSKLKGLRVKRQHHFVARQSHSVCNNPMGDAWESNDERAEGFFEPDD